VASRPKWWRRHADLPGNRLGPLAGWFGVSSLRGRVYRAQMVRDAFDDGRRQTNRPSDRTPEEQVESPLRLLRSMTT